MLKYLCLFLGLTNLVMSLSIPHDSVDDVNNSKTAESSVSEELVLVGHVDTKSYYSYNSNNMNWTDAKAVCERNGMMLASMETKAEIAFLRTAYEPGVFHGLYWSAARDSLTLSQLRWDKGSDDQTEITEDLDLFWITDYVKPALSCGVVSSVFEKLAMFMVPCNQKNEGYGALCELTQA